MRGVVVPAGVYWMVGSVLVAMLVSVFPAAAASIPGVLESGSQKWWDNWEDTGQPSLATDQVNITAVLGHTATLPCRVYNLRDRTVSWIRARDSAVLAVDRHTITTDSRFSVNHPEETEDWQLVVRGVQLVDEGIYDCQVNTHPKISTKVNLKVLSNPREVSILDIPVSDTGVISQPAEEGGSEAGGVRLSVQGKRRMWVEEGATLRLVCEAQGKGLPALMPRNNQPLISWTLDDIPVTSHWSHNKVMVHESWYEGRVVSEMVVRGLHESDDGAYTCHAADILRDRVIVTVIHAHDAKTTSDPQKYGGGICPTEPDFGGHPEAAESASAGSASSSPAVVSGAIILVLLLIQAMLCCFYIRKL